VRNARSVTLDLDRKESEAVKTYTVRLYFAQPAGVVSSAFDVAIQGKVVTPGMDVAREAGGVNRSLVKVYRGVRVRDKLVVELKPAKKGGGTVLSGIEVMLAE
jgi:hypothetical protein